MINAISILLIFLGELCILVAVLGVFRMDYILNRMHATTIADTLGTLLVFLGVILHFGFSWVSAKLILVVIFQWTTCPVSAHLIGRMIYYSQEADLKKHAEYTYLREEEGKN